MLQSMSEAPSAVQKGVARVEENCYKDATKGEAHADCAKGEPSGAKGAQDLL